MQYNSIPVFSNLSLIEELKKLEGSAYVRSLIFLNCGGLIDLTSMWFYGPESKVDSFIFDAHRPFHHNNIIDVSRKIYVIHDGCESFDKYPTHEDFQFLQEMEGEEDDDEDDFDDDDSEKEEAKEELNDLKDNGSDEEEEVFGDRVEKSGEEDVGEGALVGQRRQREEPAVDRRVLKRQKKALIQKYYSGSFFWKCTASTMYQLYLALNRSNNDALWLWILGMTDLIVHQRQTMNSLDNDMLDCGNEVIRLNPNIYNRLDDQADEDG